MQTVLVAFYAAQKILGNNNSNKNNSEKIFFYELLEKYE